MKRTLFLVFVVTSTPLNQTNAQLLESFGLKLALTSASQKIDYGNTPSSLQGASITRRIGFNAAVYAEWLKISMFSFVTQVEYAQRGFTQDFKLSQYASQLIPIDQRNVRIDYLSVPLLVKVSPSQWYVSPYLIAGGRLDIRMGARDNLIGSSWITDNFRKTIWGGTAGMGLESHSLLPIPIMLEFRYNVDAVDSYDLNSVKARNNAFDLWLGVAF